MTEKKISPRKISIKSKKTSPKKSVQKPVGSPTKAVEIEISAHDARAGDTAPPPAHLRYRLVPIPNSDDVLLWTWNAALNRYENPIAMTRETSLGYVSDQWGKPPKTA